MTYAYDLESGQRLILQNDGDDTLVALSSGDEGQQQSQSSGFQTGKWAKTPELFQTRGGLVLRLETKNGMEYIRIRGSQIQSMRSEPDLENAEKSKLKKSDENVAMKPMGADAAIGAHETNGTDETDAAHETDGADETDGWDETDGNADGRDAYEHGSRRNGGAPAKQFCTQCGKPVQKKDRFCASCGHRLLE